jgi:hypothetical protein
MEMNEYTNSALEIGGWQLMVGYCAFWFLDLFSVQRVIRHCHSACFLAAG